MSKVKGRENEDMKIEKENIKWDQRTQKEKIQTYKWQ